MSIGKKVDRTLKTLTGFLIIVGFLVFVSSSMGLLPRGGASYSLIIAKQGIIELIGIVILIILAKQVPYKLWQKYSVHFLVISIILTLLVFIPSIGLSVKGGTRWIDLGIFTFQPAELLKLAAVIFLSAHYARIRNGISDFVEGLLPLIGIVAVIGAILLAQPDTGTFIVIVCALVAIFIYGGGRWSHLLIVMLLSIIGFAGLAMTRPYLQERIQTFINPESDTLGSSYHLRQSLISIGSGQISGRGFGQSVQKFSYLPEPIGDSIFSVFSEEFGFIGSTLLVILITIFALRGLKVSDRAPDKFGRYLGVGIVTLIVAQSFINICALIGLIPLTGVPLVFVSQGGTALLVAFIEVGILLNISKYSKP